jgi:subfamily B ATP-binding cassette protein MsbA
VTFVSTLLSYVPIASPLVAASTAIIAVIILKNIVGFASVAVLCTFYGRLSHSLRVSVFRRILDRPLAELERERSGHLLNVLTTETWRATDALNSVFATITSLATLLVFLTLLFLLSWQFSLIALACSALIPPLVQIVTRRVKALSQPALAANAALSQQTWSALNALRTIHAFGREASETERFADSSEDVRRLFLRMSLLGASTAPITEVLVSTAIAGIAILISNSHVELGTLISFMAILLRLQPRILALVASQASLAGNYAAVEAVTEVLRLGQRRVEHHGPALAALSKGIVFRDVTFTYHGAAAPALSNVSCELPKGAKIAIVGASGSGKSTFLDIILSFQTPQHGAVLVDGLPLVELDPVAWRARLAVVGQDPYVFHDTIRANIGFGREDADDMMIREAARIGCADGFIEHLPAGYGTVVGERGAQISGGQRQRIALARALVRKPDILILDEATNALDAQTETLVQDSLRQFAKDRTVITVSHRVGAVLGADLVLVLEAGRLVEIGPPAALMEQGGTFARLYASQGFETADLLPEPEAVS